MIKKKTLRTCGMLAMSAIMVLSTFATAFAAPTDTTRQENSDATGTVNLEKTLTVNQANKFPKVEDFTFTFERIKAWDNANTSTAQNGTAIAIADIPMPAVSTTAHHTISAVNANKVSVTTGDYSVAATGDTSTARTRNTPLTMTYTKAGYYVYKVNEVNDGVAGITYDSDAYYVVVYVANNQDENGNTVSGVYVHSITIWENIPSLSAIGNVNNGQDIGVDPDNPQDAEEKKDITPPEPGEPDPKGFTPAPNAIKVNFDNLSASNDVIISKNVKGSLGDKTKQFEFTVTLTGLVAGTTYDISGTGTLVSASVGTLDVTNKKITPDATGKATFLVKLTDDQNIKIEGLPVGATYKVNEAASDHIPSYAITSTNKGTEKTVYTEVAVNEMVEGTTYYTTNDGTDEAVEGEWVEGAFVFAGEVPSPDTVVYQKTTQIEGGPVIVKETDSKTEKDNALETAVETVNATDQTVTVAYTNTRNMSTLTGVPGLDYIIYGLIALVMIGSAALVIRRRKSYADELNA